MTMKLAVVQMNSTADVARNVATARELMEIAVKRDGATWLLLPEHFQWAGGDREGRLGSAEILGEGPAYRMCRDFAREYGVNVHAGSIYEALPEKGRVANTSIAFDRGGNEVARYRKIHLFDITGPDGAQYLESETVRAGDTTVVYEVDGVKFGCAICYDLRFPELFRALVDQGAQVIALPAAFTLQTGKDHWEPLIRARAIETQCYLAAAGSCGSVPRNGQPHYTYGHSMIVDPWGHKVAQVSDGDGVAVHNFDVDLVAKTRRDIPLARHRAM